MSYSIGIVDTLIYGGNIMKIKYLILTLAAIVPGIIPMEKPEKPHASVLGKRQTQELEKDLDEQPQTKISRHLIVLADSDSDSDASNSDKHQNTHSSAAEHNELSLYSSEEKNNSIPNTITKNGVKFYECDHKHKGCNFVTRRQDVLYRHMTITHSINPSDLSQQQNTRSSVSETTHKSPECNKKFSNHYYLNKHMMETGHDKFKCNHKGCNFVTRWQGVLDQHIKRKHSAKPSDSSQHEKIHSNEPETRHKCNYCDNWFTKDILDKHMAKIHNKLPLYSSEEKDNSVQSAITVTETGFKCNHKDCNYATKYVGLLKEHIEIWHSTNPSSLKCTQPGCNYVTKWRGNLNQHMIKHHGFTKSQVLNSHCQHIISIPSSLQSKVIPIENAFITSPTSAPIKIDLTKDDLLSIPIDLIDDMQLDSFDNQDIPSEKNIDAKSTNELEGNLLQELDDALEDSSEDSSDCGGTTETASSPDTITSKDAGNQIPFDLPVELPDSFDDQNMSEKNVDAKPTNELESDLLEELDDALEDSSESESTTETPSSPDTTNKNVSNRIPLLIANVLSKRSAANDNKKALAVHKTIQAKVKPVTQYRCNECGNNFTAKSSLAYHIKNYHEKKYECMHCNYSTAHRSNLDYHEKTQHQRV